MKFYIVQSSVGDIEGCFTRRDDAMWHLSNHHQTVQMLDVPISTETVRRLLGEEGAYAREVKQIYPKKGNDND